MNSNPMKAAVYSQYGGPEVLFIQEVPKPSPQDNQVLIKVYASCNNAGDWHLLRGTPLPVRLMVGVFKPQNQILGVDVSGKIEAIGKNITKFHVGDEVMADLSSCGFGGFAEYVCATENALSLKPLNMTFEQAACVPTSAVTALMALRNISQIQKGQKVLIHGASGGVGTFAVQIAKAFGGNVTGVCSSRHIDLVRSLGADEVIDYTKQDFTKNGQKYDFILAANGYHSIFEYQRCLTPNGTYVMTGGSGEQMAQALFLGPLISFFGKQKMATISLKRESADLEFMRQLIESGKVISVIDKTYPLSQVAEAIAYLEAGHAKGKIAITVVKE